jgi:hypothetical protein
MSTQPVFQADPGELRASFRRPRRPISASATGVGTKVITRRLAVSSPARVATGQTGGAISEVPLSRAASSNKEGFSGQVGLCAARPPRTGMI